MTRLQHLSGRCDCGIVTVGLPDLPEKVNACPCDYCRRVGARWGYYDGKAVDLQGATDTYLRADRVIEFHRCRVCGVTTHWQFPGRAAGSRVGINMTNFNRDQLADVPVVASP